MERGGRELGNPLYHDRSRVESQVLLFRTWHHLCRQGVALESRQLLRAQARRLSNDVVSRDNRTPWTGRRKNDGNRDGDRNGDENKEEWKGGRDGATK